MSNLGTLMEHGGLVRILWTVYTAVECRFRWLRVGCWQNSHVHYFGYSAHIWGHGVLGKTMKW